MTKVYGSTTVALDQVDLSVGAGEIVGLVGSNGAGKSTLVKILSGVEFPTSGEFLIGGRVFKRFPSAVAAHEIGIGVVHQELPLFPNLSAAENVVVGLEGRHALARRGVRGARMAYVQVAEQLANAPSPDAIVGDLPLDQRQLVAICRALSRGAWAIILDEPTSALPPSDRSALHRTLSELRDAGLSVLYVSHILQDVLGTSDRVVILRDGRIVGDHAAESLSLSDVIRAMTGTEDVASAVIGDRGAAPPRRQRRIECSGLCGTDFGPVDLRVGEAEIVGLYGLEGCGADALLETIYGLRPSRGDVRLDGRTVAGTPADRIARGIGFATGDRSKGVIASWSVADNVALPALAIRRALAWQRPGAQGDVAADPVKRLGVKARLDDRMDSLSGGNQQKTVLARWLTHPPPRCLLLHEPTRGIDAAGKRAVQRDLMRVVDKGTSVLMYASDPEDLTAVCDRVLIMAHGVVRSECGADDLSVPALEAAAQSEVAA